MTTALDLISQAQRAIGVLGVGQTMLAEDINDGFSCLKQMIAQWQKRRWIVPSLRDIYMPGNSQVSNTIGVGGYFPVPRPDKIQAAYVRLNSTNSPSAFPDFNGDFNNDFNNDPDSPPTTATSSTVDYQLSQLFSFEDYSRIKLKGLNSFPYAFFYDAAYPKGNLFVWPIPSAIYEVHVIIKSSLQVFENLNDEILLPGEYEEAIYLNLAIRLAVQYQTSASKELVALAKVALNTIKNANAQVPELGMPRDLVVNGPYNFFSDQVM
jgi:hypothetical protein